MSMQRDTGAQELFVMWARSSRGPKCRALTDRTQRLYASIWSRWLTYLAATGTHWLEATPETLDAFSRSPQQRARPKKSSTARPSLVTIRRYFEVVRAVYRDLPLLQLSQGLTESSPHPIARLESPPDTPRRMESTVLSAPVLACLRTHVDAQLVSDTWIELRDKVVLGIALDTACTLAELQSLRVDDCLYSPNSDRVRLRVRSAVKEGHVAEPNLPAQARSLADDRTPTFSETRLVERARPRKHASRELELSASTARWLSEWLSQRELLTPVVPYLFVGAKDLGPLTAPTLWRVVSAAVRAAHQSLGQATPYHLGPGVVRSSVMLNWLLRGGSIPEVACRAGLKSPRSLERLVKHATDDVRLAYAALQTAT